VHWLDPFVSFIWWVVLAINKPIGNLGWSMIILAALIRLVFWPLNTAQFKAFLKMQKIAPMLKRVQERYKDDKQKQQQETMALYKSRASIRLPAAGRCSYNIRSSSASTMWCSITKRSSKTNRGCGYPAS